MLAASVAHASGPVCDSDKTFMALRFSYQLLLGIAAYSALASVSRAEVELAKYRTGKPDPRLAQVPAELEQAIFAKPTEHVDRLVDTLTRGADDPFHKTQILHDWIATHISYDVDSFRNHVKVDSAWAATLRARQSVCQGYSALLAEMCRRAGIECEQIVGQARGYGYLAADHATTDNENHAWNAVRIEGRWYLIDVTWDAGTVSEAGFQQKFSHAYLFLEPHDFLFTHLPSDSQWQLVEKPISVAQFEKQPNLKGRFFQYGLRLDSPIGSRVVAQASLKVKLRVPRDVVVSVKLRDQAGDPLPRHTLLQRVGDDCMVLAMFPRAEQYKLELFCKHKREPTSLLLAASFSIAARQTTDRVFPQVFNVYHELPACVYEPLLVPLDRRTPQTFRVRAPETDRVQLAIDDRPWITLDREKDDRDLFSTQVMLDAAQRVRLMIRRPGDGRSALTLLDYSAP